MSQNELKQQAALAAIEYIKPDMIVGVGTGSTVNFFIEELAKVKAKIEAAVSSSQATTERLKALHIPVIPLDQAPSVDIYIDGADEVTKNKHMIKGGGAALTGEKIVAACAKQFICVVDESKVVETLGAFPLPIEVIPMARSYVAREMVKLGGTPEYRQGVVTDYGNHIIDVRGLDLTDALAMENRLNQIAGVVTNGIFAHRPADVVLVASTQEVRSL